VPPSLNPKRMLFPLQLFGELRKLFARKRTYIGFGAFLAVEVVVLILFQLPKVQRSYGGLIERAGYGFADYFSGLTLAFLILTSTIFLLGSLYLALVAGDVVSKEVEEGTMRMMLCRPVSRLRLLGVKYLACVIYTFALILFIGLTALAAGILRQGFGGLFVYAPIEGVFALYEKGPGLARYLASLPLLALSLLAVTSLGFALSCFNMKPAAATITTLTYVTVDFIFKSIPYFESVKHWFLTTHMATWTNIYRPEIPWPQMAEDYAYLLAVDLTLVIIAAVNFQQRDFKS
jgi:ABC-2 type transport system permease protein